MGALRRTAPARDAFGSSERVAPLPSNAFEPGPPTFMAAFTDGSASAAIPATPWKRLDPLGGRDALCPDHLHDAANGVELRERVVGESHVQLLFDVTDDLEDRDGADAEVGDRRFRAQLHLCLLGAREREG